MKTKSEVSARLQLLLQESLAERLAETQKRLPSHCRYHLDHPIDLRKTVNGEVNPNYNRLGCPHGQVVGLCLYGARGEEWTGDICEDAEDAQCCSKFDSIYSRERVTQDFWESLKDKTQAKRLYPGVYELAWVLDMTAPRLSWWRRARLWIRRWSVEALAPSPERDLLPPKSDQ